MAITSLSNRSYQLYTISNPDAAESSVANPANIPQPSIFAAASAVNEGSAQPIAGPELEYEQQGPKRITATKVDREKDGYLGEQHKWQPVAAVLNRIAAILHLVTLLICFLGFVSALLSSSD